MIRNTLTYLTILAITALPVQLISVSAATLGMQMSMSQSIQASKECLHETSAEVAQSCCEDSANTCQGCNDIPHASSVMTSQVHVMVKISLLNTTKFSIGHLLLDGVPQKNLLRPPKTLI